MTDKLTFSAIVLGVLLALGLGIGGFFIGQGVVNARVGDRAVTVRGLAERDVLADIAVLPLRITASGDVLSEVQAQGYRAEDVDLGRLEVTDVLAREYRPDNVTARFILAQTLVVRTTDVARVQATSRALGDLVRQGVVLQDFRGPSYFFTGLNDVRPSMIAEATASARSGAEQFARDSGTSLGPIKQATQGSFEILPRDPSVDGDETASVNKRIRVVTTITYRLR